MACRNVSVRLLKALASRQDALRVRCQRIVLGDLSRVFASCVYGVFIDGSFDVFGFLYKFSES